VCGQSSSKKVITKEEWEKKLSEVKIRKEDMNKLVMNFLVTEGYVEAAEKFQMESGTQRIPFFFCNGLANLLCIPEPDIPRRSSGLFKKIPMSCVLYLL
jgi:hypothetical protein